MMMMSRCECRTFDKLRSAPPAHVHVTCLHRSTLFNEPSQPYLFSISSATAKTPSPTLLRPVKSRYIQLKKLNQNKSRDGKCRAEFSADAPVAVAIGACILNSLIFPEIRSPEDSEPESIIDSDDARFAVMGIISFIPYFNWMSWVFAWMDTGKRRYAVYAFAYLAPYLRPNISISPEDSWLPVASILLCIGHIQLEASITNGDIQGIRLFTEGVKYLSSMKKQGGGVSDDETKDIHNLPSAREHYEIRDWVPPARKLEKEEDCAILNEDENVDGGAKH